MKSSKGRGRLSVLGDAWGWGWINYSWGLPTYGPISDIPSTFGLLFLK